MKRADDFEVRRQHIANLTDEELYAQILGTDQTKVVDPLLELRLQKNTTPSVERCSFTENGCILPGLHAYRKPLPWTTV